MQVISLSRMSRRACNVFGALIVAMLSPLANAHYMVAQHGTLNLVDGDIYMVLSVPVSAFSVGAIGLDADANGKVDMIEFNRARQAIKKYAVNNISLVNSSGNSSEDNARTFEIKGVQVIPELTHHDQQIVIMGKYEVQQNTFDELAFSMSLFGSSDAEKRFELAVSDKKHHVRNTYMMTPSMSLQALD